MAAQILVAFATRNGSTAEIAQAIGKELISTGYPADIAEIKTISTLAGYRAVVIGGPLYMGSVDGDVGKFIGKNREQLQKLSVAAVAVGRAPTNTDPDAVGIAMAALKKSLEPVTPVVSVMFAGKLDPKKLSFIQRKITELVKSPAGDFRDWTLIASWAHDLPGKMGLVPPPKN